MAARSDAAVAAYHRELVARLRAVLDHGLVGIYAGGSWALGDYEPGRSDLDVAAITRGALGQPAKEAIVASVRHEALRCPARGLELVVYSDAAARAPHVDADFELNLNTGGGMAFRADFKPGDETHWFAIDRSILAAHGVALSGPPPEDVFAPIPRRPLLEVLLQGIDWWKKEPATSDAVLNGCRSLRFAITGDWASKRAAGEWALDNGFAPNLVRDALAARTTRAPLNPRRVRRFLRVVESGLREQVAGNETEHRR